MSQRTNAGLIITFYSWKGGVGRTMALANIAVQLTRMGSRVLTVDWDLEAPGLDRYFISADKKNANVSATQPADQGGLMGLLHEASKNGYGSPDIEQWRKKLTEISIARAGSSSGSVSSKLGRLELLSSGQGSEGYSEKLAEFSWENFFSNSRGGEWLEALRQQWRASYDFVLLDSRTGLSDSGGICTVQMPDILVLVFTANDQSFEGGLRVVEAAQKERAAFEYDRGPLAVIPLLSRWEGENEVDIGKEWMQRFNVELSPLTRMWLPKVFSPRQFLEKTRVPHVARFTFGEPLPVLTHSITDPGLPGIYFDTVARLIQSNLADAGTIVDANYSSEVPRAYGAKPIVLPYSSLGALFKGRDEFMLRLGEAFTNAKQKGVSIQAIYGLGGVGKTRAAVEYAWSHQDDYTALFFATADTPESLRANIADLAVTLFPAIEVVDEEARFIRVVEWLRANRAWLLILDNVDTQSALAAVEGAFGRLTNGNIIITTRLANFSAHIAPLELDVLDVNDATAFLLDRSRGRRRAAADDGLKAQELAVELGQLALALEQAAAFISRRRMTIRQYLDEWRAKSSQFLNWSDETVTDYPRAVAITWQTSFSQLRPTSGRMLQRLSWFASERIPEALLDVRVLAFEEEDLHAAFDELSNYSLVTRESEGPYFLVHRLVQEVTRQSLNDDARQSSLIDALNWINDAFPYNSDDVRYWPQAETLAPHARVVLEHADAAGIKVPTGRLMNQLALFFSEKALYNEAESFFRRCLAIEEEVSDQKPREIATVLSNLAVLLKETGRISEAESLTRRALDIAESRMGPDDPSVATFLNNLADIVSDLGRLDEAEQLMRRSLVIGEKTLGPDDPALATRLNNLASQLFKKDRLAEAEPLLRRALSIDEKALGPDHPDTATDLNNLGWLLRATSQYAEAELLTRRALAIYEKALTPDHPRVAMALENLAILLEEIGRTREAEPLRRRAQGIRGNQQM
jgi:tetratricopeptide (TPR) repeat protein/MinD-like ATPase involved in chromosome partitioning or flagellar assembly